MKAVFVLFDSLNRHMLGPYGGTRVPTPNFDRLAARCVTFDRHYVGSLPCMPARRDILSGRLSFLHRSWGPMEPFDNAFPDLLHQAGVYSHLITDHFHYWEDGGATYHNRYDSYELCAARKAIAGRRWCSRTGSVCARCIMISSSRPIGETTGRRTWSTASSSRRRRISPR